jgi:hypothetical protein
MEKETTSATVMPFYADERGYHEKDEGYDNDAVVVRAIGTCKVFSFRWSGRALNLSIR